MDAKPKYHTQKGYRETGDTGLSPAMEDYLEMICRLFQEQSEVRIRDLSDRLSVRPPSASKMVQLLAQRGFLETNRYGAVTLTEDGRKTGRYLLFRHEVIYRFLRYLASGSDSLREAEQIEHYLSRPTVEQLNRLMLRLTASGGNA